MNMHEQPPKVKKSLDEIQDVTDYLTRIGAELTGLLRATVETKGDNGYRRERVVIKFDREGGIDVTSFPLSKEELAEYQPTVAESAAIEAAIKAVELHKSINSRVGSLPPKLMKVDAATLFPFLSQDGREQLFLQQRVEQEDGSKAYLPWTFFSDGEWRCMEPDGLLPLYGLENLRPGVIHVMINEGVKAGRAARDLPEGHPWKAALKNTVQLGWPGGAYGSHKVDWSPLARLGRNVRLTIVADNDPAGVEAVSKISRLLKGRALGSSGSIRTFRRPLIWPIRGP